MKSTAVHTVNAGHHSVFFKDWESMSILQLLYLRVLSVNCTVALAVWKSNSAQWWNHCLLKCSSFFHINKCPLCPADEHQINFKVYKAVSVVTFLCWCGNVFKKGWFSRAKESNHLRDRVCLSKRLKQVQECQRHFLRKLSAGGRQLFSNPGLTDWCLCFCCQRQQSFNVEWATGPVQTWYTIR